jgi:hypothetical protein
MAYWVKENKTYDGEWRFFTVFGFLMLSAFRAVLYSVFEVLSLSQTCSKS